MAKRLTDTDKWKHPWLEELPHVAQLVWLYILDDCDHAGIWIANFRCLSSRMRSQITKEQLAEWFGTKLVAISDDKYYIPAFVSFQYKLPLNADNRVHRSIIDRLSSFGIDQKQGASVAPSVAPSVAAKDKDKDTSKDSSSLIEDVPDSIGPTCPTSDERVANIDACSKTWTETLSSLGIDRALIPHERETIARAIVRFGAEAVNLALRGARFEAKSKDWNPADFVCLGRIFEKDRATGGFRIDKFVNLGTKKGSPSGSQGGKLKKFNDAGEVVDAIA